MRRPWRIRLPRYQHNRFSSFSPTSRHLSPQRRQTALVRRHVSGVAYLAETSYRRHLGASMHYLGLLVLCALAVWPLHIAATTLPQNWNNMRTKHRWNVVPDKWERIGQPPVGTKIDLRIALRPHHESALIDTLYEVSDPRHPKYGAYLSKEQVAELVAPHPDSLKLIESWLKYHDVFPSNVSRSHGGGWLTVTGVPVSKANDLLGASYQLYRHVETNETILRTISYALPSVLHGHVRTVAPTTYFGSLGSLRQRPRVHRSGVLSDSYPDVITPSVLRSMYKSENYEPVKMDQNMLGITGFLGEYAGDEDLTEFMVRYRSEGSDATFTVVDINDGGYDWDEPGEEANLDMQYAQGMAWPTPHVFYSIGGLASQFIPDSYTTVNSNEPYLEWLEVMIQLPSLPQTISTSYGVNEQTFPPDYAKSVCDLFAQLGSRGVSLLFASGDEGVGGGTARKTMAPAYASSRGFPDVSAQAVQLLYIQDDKEDYGHGTSGSTPHDRQGSDRGGPNLALE
ncbi:Pro-kumamolisin, activation domain-containing protein [Lactarius quietus]|nr:Pro-kumamolisin, activation domain-containing protein [Lactarius quietus]